jgi:beta-galactosidase
MEKYCSVVIALIILSFSLPAQQIYTIDAKTAKFDLKQGHLKMGYTGPGNKELAINNRYMTIAGKPVFPVMGEMHFSRMPREQWEDAILKMKACGINVIATYVFWIHHEEIEGKFDWSGNKDLRAFLELCKKHGLYAYPRIGPWCHGEVRNGGTPDWLLKKNNIVERTMHPVYKMYVERLYQQIALQMEGLLYKDGGPIIGIQLENEYGHGSEGEPYILWLKHTAQKFGIDVPMYTVTGWGNGSVPPNEVIPLWGAYPDAPWDPNIERMSGCENFQFVSVRDNEKIGNDLPQKKNQYPDNSLYPYFTCEMGVGNMNTNHRRLVISAIDGYAMASAKTGSGSNLLGYYVFAGGSNPVGILSSMEENQDETGYWNTNPVISYDFMAAIKESGQLAPSYNEVKKFHYFLQEFGDRLAPMEPVTVPKSDKLQYTVRVKDNAGFLFGINYCRWSKKSEIKDVQFRITLKNDVLLFPLHPVSIPDSSIFTWPFNFEMNGAMLRYATAQPVLQAGQKDLPIWIFIQDIPSKPEFCFVESTISDIESTSGEIIRKDNKIIISELVPGSDCVITFKNTKGLIQKIVLLSREESKHLWLFNENGNKDFYLSDANMYYNNSECHVYGYTNTLRFEKLLSGDSGFILNNSKLKAKSLGLFNQYEYTVPEKKIQFELKQDHILYGADWLNISVREINKDNFLNHRFFMKEFSLGNPSAIKSAKMYISSQIPYRLQLNNIWVNQAMDSDKLNIIDLTGYVKRGENTVLLEFPFSTGNKAYAARIIVDYFNSDRYDFFTDDSWLMNDSYTFPSYLLRNTQYLPPEKSREIPGLNPIIEDMHEYSLTLPKDYMDGLNNLYALVRYSGDKARCRLNSKLIADDFNSNVPWCIGFKRLGDQVGHQQLKFELKPLGNGYKIYFDKPPGSDEIGRAEIKDLQLLPEYKVILTINR